MPNTTTHSGRKADVQPKATPEAGSLWKRHAGDAKFHTGAPRDGSYVTYCRGRWPLADVDRGLVEEHASPPHNERCESCQRQLIEVMRVNRGLRELADFDLGGEG